MIKQPLRFSDSFECPIRKIEISFALCIDNFVSANAFKLTESRCFNCQTGKEKREQFAPPPDSLDKLNVPRPKKLPRKKFKRILD